MKKCNRCGFLGVPKGYITNPQEQGLTSVGDAGEPPGEHKGAEIFPGIILIVGIILLALEIYRHII